MARSNAGRHRVLAVIDSLAVGGAQRHLATLCRHMNSGAYPTDVFSLTGAANFFGSRIGEAGSAVHIGAHSRSALPKIAWKLAATLRGGRYGVVHTYLPASFLFGALLRAKGVPHVTTICAREEQIHSSVLSFRNYGRLQARTERFVTPFPAQLRRLGVPEEKIRFALFANDYELEKRILVRAENPVAKAHGLGAGPIMVAIGRLHPDKGHEFAIAAHSTLRRKFPGATLLILGEGSDEARLRGLAGEGVLFCGVHAELAPFYSLADVYLNTAVNEGLNLSQLQAMAYGVPTVAFDTGFMEYEQAGKEDAMVRVPVGDVGALTAAITDLLESKARHEAVAAVGRTFSSQYASERVYREYAAVYDELLAESAPDKR
jgi:glycosyltransferase involved in cell wall biosynthesis